MKHMKEFLNTYADVLQSNHEQVGQVHIDFKRQCIDLTVEKLLERFVQSKYTGFEKPGKDGFLCRLFFFSLPFFDISISLPCVHGTTLVVCNGLCVCVCKPQV